MLAVFSVTFMVILQDIQLIVGMYTVVLLSNQKMLPGNMTWSFFSCYHQFVPNPSHASQHTHGVDRETCYSCLLYDHCFHTLFYAEVCPSTCCPQDRINTSKPENFHELENNAHGLSHYKRVVLENEFTPIVPVFHCFHECGTVLSIFEGTCPSQTMGSYKSLLTNVRSSQYLRYQKSRAVSIMAPKSTTIAYMFGIVTSGNRFYDTSLSTSTKPRSQPFISYR